MFFMVTNIGTGRPLMGPSQKTFVKIFKVAIHWYIIREAEFPVRYRRILLNIPEDDSLKSRVEW